MAQRIKGQEVQVVAVVNGQVVQSVNAVKNFEVTFKVELLQEGYLGETTDRYDSIFKGCHGSLEIHYDTKDVLNTVKAIVDKAARRTPSTKINIKATLNFPSGQIARVVFRDVEFGEIPLNFGGRADYGSIKLEFGCGSGQILN